MRRALAPLAAAAALLSACASGGGAGHGLAQQVEFDGPDGTDYLKLTPTMGEVVLEDGYGDDFGRYAFEGSDRLTVGDGEGAALGVLLLAAGGGALEARASDDGRLLFRIEREPDGDLRVVDGAGRPLAKLKRRDDGYKLVDAQEQEHARVKARPGKTSLRDPADRTLLSTRDAIPAAAVACFGLDALPVAFQGACALAALEWKFPGAE